MSQQPHTLYGFYESDDASLILWDDGAERVYYYHDDPASSVMIVSVILDDWPDLYIHAKSVPDALRDARSRLSGGDRGEDGALDIRVEKPDWAELVGPDWRTRELDRN